MPQDNYIDFMDNTFCVSLPDSSSYDRIKYVCISQLSIWMLLLLLLLFLITKRFTPTLYNIEPCCDRLCSTDDSHWCDTRDNVGNELLSDFDEMCFQFTSDFSIGGDYGYLGFAVQFEATNDPYPSYNLTIDDCDPVSADCIMVEFPLTSINVDEYSTEACYDFGSPYLGAT